MLCSLGGVLSGPNGMKIPVSLTGNPFLIFKRIYEKLLWFLIENQVCQLPFIFET
jgi:hypothetical protein